MRLRCLSLNHEQADLALREVVAVPSHQAGSRLSRLLELPGVREGVLLCTCNRTELYAVWDARESPEISSVLTEGLDADTAARVSGKLTALDDAEAVAHLFGLACGLKSLVVGETEILGQIKKAYADALAVGASGHILNALFQKAFSVAKEIRSGTRIGRFRVSVASVAVDEALRSLPDLGGERVSVWGTGPVGRAAVQAFAQHGLRGGRVISRDLHRARLIARDWEGVATLREDVPQALRESDVFVSCTGAPHAVITSEMVAAAMKGRTRPLLLVDLAVPRDVAEDVVPSEMLHLLNLDTLAETARRNHDARIAEACRIQPMLVTEAGRFWHCLNASLSEKCLAGWRVGVEEGLRREMETMLSDETLSPELRQPLERIADRLLKKMLDWPMKAMARAVREGLPCGDIFPEMPLDETLGDDVGGGNDAGCGRW